MPGLSPVSTRPADLPYWIAAFGANWAFDGGPGTPVTVTYALDETGTDGFGQALRPLSDAEVANIERSLAALAADTGLTFVETPLDTANMRIGASSSTTETAYGRTWQYSSQAVVVVAYDVVYANPEQLAANSYIYQHELLHGVGLGHSTRAFGSALEVVIPDDEDNGTTLFGSWSGYWQRAPQLFDVAAMQYLYGPNPEARAGDDIYVPSLLAFDAANPGPTSPLLWDGAGVDTIDLSTATGPAIATLEPGPVSRVGTAEERILEAGTFSINYHSVFEALIGTPHADRLSGWVHNDSLTGGAGHDTLTGAKGDDDLTGSGGRDWLKGGGGNDALAGNGGGDRLVGNNGSDRLDGGAGRDRLEGGKGADQLTGGKGLDRFIFDTTVRTGADRITDFDDGVDLIRIAGRAFEDLRIEDGASGALIAWKGGSVTLDGLAAAALTENDFEFV